MEIERITKWKQLKLINKINKRGYEVEREMRWESLQGEKNKGLISTRQIVYIHGWNFQRINNYKTYQRYKKIIENKYFNIYLYVFKWYIFYTQLYIFPFWNIERKKEAQLRSSEELIQGPRCLVYPDRAWGRHEHQETGTGHVSTDSILRLVEIQVASCLLWNVHIFPTWEKKSVLDVSGETDANARGLESVTFLFLR